MNTSKNTSTASSYTPLETVLLFRGIGHHGLEASAFARISDTLKTNALVKNESTYDPRRLSPEALQELFLRLLWDEIRLESDKTPGPDGPLSPASKKRRLDTLPIPTLRDAPRYVEKIELAYAKYHQAYIQHAIQQVRDDERRFDQLQADIERLERAELEDQKTNAGKVEAKIQPAIGVQDGAKHAESTLVNGVGPSPKPSPKPSPRIPVRHPQIQQQQQQPQQQQCPPTPQPQQQPQQQISQPQLPQQPQVPQVPQPQSQSQQPQLPQAVQQPAQQAQAIQQQQLHQPQQAQQAQQPLRPLQPLLPQLAPAPTPRPDARNGSVSHPAQQVDRPGSAPRAPVLNHPQIARSSQLGDQDLSRMIVTRPPEPPKPPTTTTAATPQVLQAPQGVSSFQPISQGSNTAIPDGLQRPEGVVRSQQSPVPLPTHPQMGSQSHLKWEPPYQPAPGARPLSNPHQQQHGQNVFSPPPHMVSAQRPPQAPSPLQAQPNRPLPQQVMIPPQHTTGQFVPTMQPAPVRPVLDMGGVSTPTRQHPTVSSPGANTGQPPSQPGPYHNYPVSAPVHPPQLPPVHTGHAAQHGTPVHHTPVRSPVTVSSTVPPTGVPSRPGQGLVAPSQQRAQPLPHLQAPPSYSQPAPPPTVPALTSVQHEIPRVYNSPYQASRSDAADRAHPRLPTNATPGPPVRFSPLTSAPQTPAAMPRQFTVSAKITKWKTASTPSTPRPGVEFRLGWDEMPSPAFEPNSPIQEPAQLPTTRQVAATTPAPLTTPREDVKKPHQTVAEAAETPSSKRKSGKSRAAQPSRDTVSPSPGASSRKEFSKIESENAPESVVEPEAAKVKVEVTTPRPTTETGDAMADESVAGRIHLGRSTKRKRDDLTPTPIHTPRDRQMTGAPREDSVPHSLPNIVLWTRHFNKVSGSAMEQIVHHRSANMFAQPIREKDAPGYNKVIKQPQDLKSIRAAINQGNRVAAQVAASLPGGDPGTSCWLPRTDDLLPPKIIINSGQLDRELAHMFANAIMYNPDPFHGPGPAFSAQADNPEGPEGGTHQDIVLGYKVDEFGVVNDARAMFLEVEKLLSELRSAEKRNAPPRGHMDGVATGTSTRQASVTANGDSIKDDGVATSFEDQDEQNATETENNDGRNKRRRTGRAQASL